MRTEMEWIAVEERNAAASAVLRELAVITRFYRMHMDARSRLYAMRHEREMAVIFSAAAEVAGELAEALDDEGFRVLMGEAA